MERVRSFSQGRESSLTGIERRIMRNWRIDDHWEQKPELVRTKLFIRPEDPEIQRIDTMRCSQLCTRMFDRVVIGIDRVAQNCTDPGVV